MRRRFGLSSPWRRASITLQSKPLPRESLSSHRVWRSRPITNSCRGSFSAGARGGVAHASRDCYLCVTVGTRDCPPRSTAGAEISRRGHQPPRAGHQPHRVEVCNRTPVVQHRVSGQELARALLTRRRSGRNREIPEGLIDDADREMAVRRSLRAARRLSPGHAPHCRVLRVPDVIRAVGERCGDPETTQHRP